MPTATLVRADLPDFRGTAHLYRLTEPIKQRDPWDDGEAVESFEFVVVSASVVPFSGPETYIFGADEAGDIKSWLELPGSYRGGLDHESALLAAGYEVAS